jgi:drug/metabolite transporter (DMT)-like permease
MKITPYSKGILLACTTSFLWGFLGVFLKYSLDFSDVITTVWIRFAFAGFGVLIFTAIKRPKDLIILKRPPKLALLSALGLAVNYWGYFKGIAFTTPSNAQILIQFAPLMLAVAGFTVFKEAYNKVKIFGIMIALIGLVLFYQNQLTNLLGSVEKYHKGNLFMIVAILGWASWAILQKHLITKWKPSQLNLLTFCCASILYAPFVNWSLFLEWSFFEYSIMIFLGINTFVAYGALAESLKLIPSNQASFIIILNPLITVATVYLLNHFDYNWMPQSQISDLGFLGIFLLILGVVLVNKKITSSVKI